MPEKQYYIYIITNQYHTVLYTGVTNDLRRRIAEHKTGKGGVFSSKYRLDKLVYYESGNDIKMAITREKQIKGGSRQKKIELINSINPNWDDLYEDFFGESK
ncbi:MAG: GIY-YIG nuclease family protein [Anaerolineales bacterium]